MIGAIMNNVDIQLNQGVSISIYKRVEFSVPNSTGANECSCTYVWPSMNFECYLEVHMKRWFNLNII